jgi:TatD DNase family protein
VVERNLFIDTHCHLDAAEFAADRADIAAAAQSAGVMRIVVPAVDRASFATVTFTYRTYPICRPAYGIHPLFVAAAQPEDLAALRKILAEGEAVAVGEIGLDYFVMPRDEDLQEEYFVAQLEIAREFDLPVILHARRAIDAVLRQLRRIPQRGGIAHAFNGSRQQAEEFIRLGFKLGFGGAMTFPRATRIRELAASLPLDSIVLETDAPDIPPQWLDGARNTPLELPRIAATLAVLRGLSSEDVARVTTANAQEVLRLV